MKAVTPCSESRPSAGSKRLSPKIALNGSSTGATIGWLLWMDTTMPWSRNSVPTVVIKDGTRKRTVISPLSQPTSTPTRIPAQAPSQRGTPQPTDIRAMR